MNIFISAVALLSIAIVLYLRYKEQLRLGFSVDKWAVSELLLGIGIAFISISIAFFMLKSFGLIEIQSVSFKPKGFFNGLGFYLVGAAVEELFFRVGLLLVLIYYLKNIWLAIIIQILLFGLLHLNNPGANYLTAFSNAVGGLMYSLALIYSGRIWMPFSLHLFWNFSQSFWGFNVSGLTYYSDIFMNISPQGPDYLNGGEYGLEGSIIGIGARFLVLGLIIGSCKWLKNHNPQLTENQYHILPSSLRPNSQS